MSLIQAIAVCTIIIILGAFGFKRLVEEMIKDVADLVSNIKEYIWHKKDWLKTFHEDILSIQDTLNKCKDDISRITDKLESESLESKESSKKQLNG